MGFSRTSDSVLNRPPAQPECAEGRRGIANYVDTNATVVARREFGAYGNTLVATGDMVNEFHFWFSSKYLDQETGLYYYGLRFYHSGMGRWMSRDPIGERGGRNLYAFVWNNPCDDVDPIGYQTNETSSQQPPTAAQKRIDIRRGLARVAGEGRIAASVKQRREYCGYICESAQGEFYFTTTFGGINEGGCNPDNAKCKDKDCRIAIWHTHYEGAHAERFSMYMGSTPKKYAQSDIGAATELQIPVYLTTPSHRTMEYEPWQGPPPQPPESYEPFHDVTDLGNVIPLSAEDVIAQIY